MFEAEQEPEFDQPQLSREEVLALALEGYTDPVRFCRLFLQHLFPSPIPWVHRGLLAILTKKVDFLWRYGEVDKIVRNFFWKDQSDKKHYIFEVLFEGAVLDPESLDPGVLDDGGAKLFKIRLHLGKFTLVMMPRGSAKTTIAGIAVPVYEVVYQDRKFTAYISESADHSRAQLHNVQRELTSNQFILSVFGDLRPRLRDDERWSRDFFETKTGIAFCAKGRGGQVRGLNHLGTRPELIIVDDVEDKESVATEEQRRKTRDWAYGDLMPALPKLKPDATIVALGTLLHPESLLQTWTRDPRWTVVQIAAVDVDKEYWWPEYMNEQKVAEEKQSYASAGQLHTFYMEYFNQIQAPEQQLLKPEWFVLATEEELKDISITAIYCDPAISPKRTADKTAIAVCGITKKGLIIVLDIHLQRGMSERAKVDHYFATHKTWGCMRAGVESVAYQAALCQLLREEMFRKGHYFEIEDVPHKTKKIERIRSVIQPRMASGYLKFRCHWPELWTEMMDLRIDTNDQPDDGSDATASCIQLLDPFSAHAAGDRDLHQNQYEPLKLKWRCA